MTDDNRPGLACAKPHHTAPLKAAARSLMALAFVLAFLAPVLAQAQINWTGVPTWLSKNQSLPNRNFNVIAGSIGVDVDTGISWGFRHNCFGSPYTNDPRRIMYSYLDNHNDKFRQAGGNSGGDNSRVELQDPANQHVRLQFKRNQRYVGVWTITLRFESNGCSQGGDNRADAVFTITTEATRSDGSAHMAASYRPFRTDKLLANTSPVTTGIILQRGATGCRNTDMRLLNHTDYLRLQYLNPNSSNAVTGALAVNHDNVPMLHSTTANRRALAVLFKAGATVRPGTLQIEVQESSNSCGSGFPSTLKMQLTVADALPWVEGPSSSSRATAVFMASAGGQPPTGIRFASHIGIASARVCDNAVVEISDLDVAGTTIKARQVTQLAYFRGTSWQGATGSRVTIAWVWSNGHARMELRNNNTPRPPAGTLTITVVASPHNCQKPGVPDNLTVAYKITVAEEWENLTRNQTAAAGGFVAPALSLSQAPTDTGIRLHRSSKGCRYIDVQLNAPSYLGLMEMRMNGNSTVTVNPGSAPVQQHQQLRMDTGAGANDRHLRLMFLAQADVGAQTRTEAVTVIGTPAARCSVGTRPTVAFTLAYMLTINARHTVEKFSKDNIAGAAPVTMVVENVQNAVAPLPTGIFIHRSSKGCSSMNVSVNNPNYLVQRFDKDGNPVGAAAQQVSGVEMNGEGNATDRQVQLLVRQGQSDRSQRQDNIPVVISAACGPETGAPLAQTERLAVHYVNTWVPVDNGFDQERTEKAFPEALLFTSSFTDTGIVFHRRIVANLGCGDNIDVDLVNGSEALFQLRKHQDDGTADGVPASSFDDVNVVSGNGRRHLRLLFGTRVSVAGGSVVKATVVSETKGNCNPKPTNLTMVYEVAIDYGQGEMPVVGDATGAAAARVIGLRGMDTVLQRSAVSDAPSGLSLLELLANKEAELESGEIDLRSFLAGQSFALGLDASASGRSRLGVWGRAETLSLEGDGDDTALRHEGDMFAAQLGVDFRVASDALFGLGYGRYEVDTEYVGRKNGGDYDGTYVLALDLVQPYAAMPFLGGDLAAAASIGSGSAEFVSSAKLTNTETTSYTDKHDAQYRGWGLGYRSQVPVSDADLGVEGSISGALLEVPDLGDGMESDNMSLRLGLEFARSIDFAAGTVRPQAGAAYARDWGDDPGSKHEFSAGVGYEAGQLSALVEFLHVGMDAGDAKANGAALAVRYAPAAGALGLGLAVAPQHGASPSSAEGKSFEELLAGTDKGLRGSAELSYGLAVDGGVLTPYGGWSFDGSASELGLRLRTGAASKWLLRWQGTAEDELKIEYRLGD